MGWMGAPLSAVAFNWRRSDSLLGLFKFFNQSSANGLIGAFIFQLSKVLRASLRPSPIEAEHVIGLIEMTFPHLDGVGHLPVSVSRCWCPIVFPLSFWADRGINLKLLKPRGSSRCHCDYHLLKPGTSETAFTDKAAGSRKIAIGYACAARWC